MIPIDADNPHGELRSVSADRGALMNNLNNQSNSSTGKFFFCISFSVPNYYFLVFVSFCIFWVFVFCCRT